MKYCWCFENTIWSKKWIKKKELSLVCKAFSLFKQPWGSKRATSPWSEEDIDTKREREETTNIKNTMQRQGSLFFKKNPVIVVRKDWSFQKVSQMSTRYIQHHGNIATVWGVSLKYIRHSLEEKGKTTVPEELYCSWRTDMTLLSDPQNNNWYISQTWTYLLWSVER